jgi:Flp pilus assembly protein TadD
MGLSASAFIRQVGRSFPRGQGALLALLALSLSLWGCASPSIDTDTINSLTPLQLDDRALAATDAAGRVPRPDLLSLDQPMREFVARYTADLSNNRMRLMSLHQAVRGGGSLDMQYDPFAEGTAQEVFHRGTANCLSYANLFVALAREAGLQASYQWQEVRPQWSRVSDRVQIGLHVNVMVRVRDGKRFVVDIDPLPSRDITDSQTLTDAEAEALYYNNVAMDAFGKDELETAWAYLVRALQLSPKMAHLWVNLGAMYRYSGQHREAEQSYLQALELDFMEYSAMTNLAVLYELEGRVEEHEYWLDKAQRHRRSNPYYHAWQGDEAATEGNWQAALNHYNRAVELLPRDSQLLFARGMIYYQLDDFDDAAVNIEKAIETAILVSDIAYYQSQLDEVRKARLAGGRATTL